MSLIKELGKAGYKVYILPFEIDARGFVRTSDNALLRKLSIIFFFATLTKILKLPVGNEKER